MNAAAVFLILATSNQYLYDDHTFALESNSSSFVLVYDSGFFPSVQDNYVVQNIGRSIIRAELWYGDELQWFGIVCGATLQPGERKVLDNGGKLYYYTGLKVYNHIQEDRAIFHADGGYVYSPYIPGANFDIFRYLRKTLRSAVKYIPVNPPNIFKDIISAFWPDKQMNVWADILNQISPMLNSQVTNAVGETIESNLNVFKNKFQNLTYTNESKDFYMAIASELNNVENKFIITNSTVKTELVQIMNVYLLPIYSNAVSMKIHYYVLGVRFKDILRLSDEEVQTIRGYAWETFSQASDHIKNISDGMVEYAYTHAEAPNIFNNIMTMRSHLAIHGNEYIPIWKAKLSNPANNNEIYNPVVSYSTFFGRPTANLYAQSTALTVPLPLNPSVAGGKKNLLSRITVYLWAENPYIIKIGGAKLTFTNGREFAMGTLTPIIENFDLDGSQILQMSVYGEGKIDGLKFYLSNNLIKSFGMVNSTSEDFKLPDHYVSSFYLSSDDRDLKGQAANIAVAYQWFVKYHN